MVAHGRYKVERNKKESQVDLVRTWKPDVVSFVQYYRRRPKERERKTSRVLDPVNGCPLSLSLSLPLSLSLALLMHYTPGDFSDWQRAIYLADL